MLPNPYHRAHAWVWTREPKSALGRRLLHLARYALALVRDLIEGEISLRAMSLVYTTLLSLVPFLALAFSVLKALGVHNSLQPVLLKLLEPLGDQAAVIAGNVIGFVNNIKVGVLGSLGVGMLLYTALSVISKIESSFNFIWNIEQTRGFTQRFGEYLSVLIVGPVLVFSAIGLTASVRSSAIVTWLADIQPFGLAIVALTELAPYALLVAAFTFMYGYIPNTRVRLSAAAGGGLFAGVAWQSASVAFARFVAGAGSYSAIYSGFAIVIVLLIWIYVGWLIILFGCRLSFYLQHPQNLTASTAPAPLAPHATEHLALRALSEIGQCFISGAPAPREDELRRVLNVSKQQLHTVLAPLVADGLVTMASDKRWLLARDPAGYTLGDAWLCCRDGRKRANNDAIEALLHELEARVVAASTQTFRDWLQANARL